MIILCFVIACAICAGVYYIGRKDGKKDAARDMDEQMKNRFIYNPFNAPSVLISLDPKKPGFTMNEYQRRARRTIRKGLPPCDLIDHAMNGLVSEVGEMCSIFQKVYQGHEFDVDHLFSELGDALWFMAELATAYNRSLCDVAEANIEKLEGRYAEQFTVEESLHRKEGDV